MVLYNITAIIEKPINDEWLKWINEEFIPRAMSSGSFTSNRLLRVLESPNEGITYCLQFVSDNADNYRHFKDSFEPAIIKDLTSQFANRFVSFNSLMEFVD